MVTYESLQHCIQPVIFRTRVKEAPLWTWGTGFSLGTQSKVFFVTARHVVQAADPADVCVLSPSGRTVPLKDSFYFDRELVTDDWADVVVHEVSLGDAIKRAPDARLIDLERAGGDWQADASTSRIFVAGFPNDHTGVDYDVNEVHGRLVELEGAYAGPATRDGYTHRLTIPNTLSLTTFNGLSGSPVLMLKRTIGDLDRFVLIGMAIQGTTQAGSILFVDRRVLTTVIDSKRGRERSNAVAIRPFSAAGWSSAASLTLVATP